MTNAIAVGAGVVVLLELRDDQQRRDLGPHRHVAGDEDDRPVFADGARERQREAGQPRRVQIRQDHAAARPASRSAPRLVAASSSLDVEILDHRLQRADDERQPDEDQRDRDAERREGDLDAVAARGTRRTSRSAHRALVSVMPATAVGSANGRSTSASTMRRPGKCSAPAPTPTSSPNTRVDDAATSDAPMLSRYDATTRGSLTVRPERTSQPSLNDFDRQREQRHEHDQAPDTAP